MRQRSYKIYLLLIFVLLLLLSISPPATQRMRGAAVAVLAPTWSMIDQSQNYLGSLFFGARHLLGSNAEDVEIIQEENRRIKLENELLRGQLLHLMNVARYEESLKKEFARLEEAGYLQAGEWSDYLERRYRDLQRILEFKIQAIPARVVYRGVSSWNSSLWVDVGEVNNRTLGHPIVSKDSPVVVGNAVVGIIDYVGYRQSRVRLITDSGLVPSVRAVRGQPQDRQLCFHIESLKESLSSRQDLFSSVEATRILCDHLEIFKKKLLSSSGGWHLAKGELHGSGAPLWRSKSKLLKGVGFNYDFPDGEGPARDLRSGKPLQGGSGTALPLLQVNDLLMTTGMDGIFPPGLAVAEISKIHMLREGSYVYELEARPAAGDLDELTTLFILPSLKVQDAAGGHSEG